jgi:hypothetical protein
VQTFVVVAGFPFRDTLGEMAVVVVVIVGPLPLSAKRRDFLLSSKIV